MRDSSIEALLMATALVVRGRRSGRSRRNIEVKTVAVRVSGESRNRPCPCGSGIKAKKCPCETYEA